MTFGVALDCLVDSLRCQRCGRRGHVAPHAHADPDPCVRYDVAVPLSGLAEPRHDDVLIGARAVDDLEHGVTPRPAVAPDVLEKQHPAAEQKAEMCPVEP